MNHLERMWVCFLLVVAGCTSGTPWSGGTKGDLATVPIDLGKNSFDLAQGPVDLAKSLVDLAEGPADLAKPVIDMKVGPVDLANPPLCGNQIINSGEEWDPPPGPFASAPIDNSTCRFHFENVPQLYCNGYCSLAGPEGCDQADADIFCKLKTGKSSSIATSFAVMTALTMPGFSCGADKLGTQLGPMATRGVLVDIWYQDSSLFANHKGGDVIVNLVCN